MRHWTAAAEQRRQGRVGAGVQVRRQQPRSGLAAAAAAAACPILHWDLDHNGNRLPHAQKQKLLQQQQQQQQQQNGSRAAGGAGCWAGGIDMCVKERSGIAALSVARADGLDVSQPSSYVR
eukprot:1159017-Pelagomonas_calceolata.AAC.2